MRGSLRVQKGELVFYIKLCLILQIISEIKARKKIRENFIHILRTYEGISCKGFRLYLRRMISHAEGVLQSLFMAFHDAMTTCPRPMCPRTKSIGCSVPWTMCSQCVQILDRTQMRWIINYNSYSILLWLASLMLTRHMHDCLYIFDLILSHHNVSHTRK